MTLSMFPPVFIKAGNLVFLMNSLNTRFLLIAEYASKFYQDCELCNFATLQQFQINDIKSELAVENAVYWNTITYLGI